MINFALTKRPGYLTILILLVLSCFPIETNAQCTGISFKTGYRKIIPALGDYYVYDWTGDGKPDFWRFVNDPNTSNSIVVVYANNGSGDFNWNNPVTYTTDLPSTSLNTLLYDLVDYNRDGKTDIFVYGGTFSRVFVNTGNNSFTGLASFVASDEAGFGQLASLGLFDVNGDSTLDWVKLISIPNTGPVISYRPGNADGTFGQRVDLTSAIPQSFQAVGDFDGDGKKDIAYRLYDGNGGYVVRVLVSKGDGTFTAGPASPAPGPFTPHVADLNNDGMSDLVSEYFDERTQPPTRHLIISRSNGGGTFTNIELPVYQSTVRLPDVGIQNFAEPRIGDFNGDGFPDILEFGDTFHSLHLSDGIGGFVRVDHQFVIGPYNYVILADFDGDRRTDIYQKVSAGRYVLNAFNEPLIVIKFAQCGTFGETKVPNFNGSHYPNLVMWNPGSGNWSTTDARWLGGSGTITTFNWGLGSLGDVPAPGDWDGDGRTDYAVYRGSNGAWYIYQSASATPLIFSFGLNGDKPVPGDYDGDGRTDTAVFRPSTGDWYIWLTGPQQLMALHWGSNGDRPVPADYDGDGKTDIAVFRPSEGNWYILRSSDQSFGGLNWGLASDTPLPADYDGDGKADIAVWRSGVWYILRSSNGAFSPIYWGSAGDIPVPVYGNREAAFPVVYRPANQVWYNVLDPAQGRTMLGTQNVLVYFGLPNN